jgi:acetyl-CoA C-acetyltransferase
LRPPRPVHIGLFRFSYRTYRSKLNVNGSSIAVGHPFAATGGRIVASLAKMLEEKGSGRGLISICAAGGQGVVAILERD